MLIVAVGGPFSFKVALVSQGIHIVGSTVGEVIPAQAGAVEGSYRLFSAAIGFSDPAKAVALALLARVSQLVVATASLVLLSTVPSLRRWGPALSQSGSAPS